MGFGLGLHAAEGDNKAKILIVDDETANIDVLVGLLGPHYNTVVAKNGEQALKRLEHPHKPDLILLDVMMPGMDGYEVCRRIKEQPDNRHIPIIFITGKNDDQDEAHGFQAGAVDYITKPFNPVIGLARVNTHIELKRRGDMLERLAHADGLTGIPNRRAFDDFLDAEWGRCMRHGNPLSLIMLDIDYFKPFNDHYGHAQGDVVLRQVARAIELSARREDLAARYGGEEFACVLPQTGMEGAYTVAERILDSVRTLAIPHDYSAAADHVTVSIGVASCTPTTACTPSLLLECTDKALYEAKSQGRNRILQRGTLMEGPTEPGESS